MKLAFPEYDLALEDCENGLWVSQHQKAYLARKWQLNEQVGPIIESAVRAGLHCLWQEGHPSGISSHHISFSFSHAPASWVFCIGDGACPPQVRKVTISKKVRGLFAQSGLDVFWENAGGKNFSIVPERLPAFLELVVRSDLRSLFVAQPLSLNRHRIAAAIGLQSERELENCIAAALEAGGANVTRQRRFPSSHFPDGKDIPDLIVDGGRDLVVIELKLYRAIEPDLIQLARYLQNAELRAAFANRSVTGVLVAADFDSNIHDAAAAMGSCSLYSYAEKTGLPLRLVAGRDLLGKFLAPKNQRLAPGFQRTSLAPRSLA